MRNNFVFSGAAICYTFIGSCTVSVLLSQFDNFCCRNFWVVDSYALKIRAGGTWLLKGVSASAAELWWANWVWDLSGWHSESSGFGSCFEGSLFSNWWFWEIWGYQSGVDEDSSLVGPCRLVNICVSKGLAPSLVRRVWYVDMTLWRLVSSNRCFGGVMLSSSGYSTPWLTSVP